MANYSYIVFLSTLIDNILDLIDMMSIIKMCIGVVYKLDKWVWKSSMLLSLLECMTLKPRAILDSPDMIQQKLFMFFSDNQTTLIWRLATLHLRTGTSMLKVRHLIWNYRQDNYFGTINKNAQFPKSRSMFLCMTYVYGKVV